MFDIFDYISRVNKDFIDRIESFYIYAERLAPGYGHDVVHHIIDSVPDKVEYLDTYVKKSIYNELFRRNSSFNRLFRPIHFNELVDVEQVESFIENYDAILLHRIFLEMEIDGYGLEVKVFKDCYLGSSVTQYCKRIKMNHRTITKICNFVKNEIIRRYTELDMD